MKKKLLTMLMIAGLSFGIIAQAGMTVYATEAEAGIAQEQEVVQEIEAVEEETLTYGYYSYEVLEDGTVAITGYDFTSLRASGNIPSVLKIPSSIDGKTVTVIGAEAFLSDWGTISTYIIPDTITTIEEQAFCGTNTTSITIPGSVKSIGKEAFRKTHLEEIIIEDGVGELGTGAFSANDYLTEITIPGSVTFKANSLGLGVFQYCDNLEKVILEEGITNTGYRTFKDCPSLTEVELPDSLKTIGEWTFCSCDELKNIDIPEGVTKIENHAFWYCPIRTIELPSSLRKLEAGVFEDCKYLINIKIPEGVTTIESGLFRQCASLANVTLPSTITYISTDAFRKDNSGTENIPCTITGYDETVAESFADEYGFEFVSLGPVPDDLPTITPTPEVPEEVFTYSVNSDGTIMITGYTGESSQVTIPAYIGGRAVKEIGCYSFYNAENRDLIRSVIIEEGVESIEADAFLNCTSLTEVSIPKSVTYLGINAFAKTGLKSVDAFSNRFFYSTTFANGNVNGVFTDCDSLTTITAGKDAYSIWMDSFVGSDNITKIICYSPYASVGASAYRFNSNVTFYAYEGTPVQEFANEYGYKFVSLGTIPTPTPTPTTAPTPTPTPVPTTAPTPVPAETRENVEAFVERMYTVVLGRASDEGGLTYWTDLLLSHETDGAGISAHFILGEEFVNKNHGNEDYLKILYKTFFNRDADEAGMYYWIQQLNAGTSRRTVLAGFVNSTEFDEICTEYGIVRGTLDTGDETEDTGIRGFVERLYTIALERASEEAGLNDWTRRIQQGENTPEEVAKFFFLSEEYVEKNTSNDKYIETLYLTFMDRGSEASGKAYWVDQLNQGVSRATALEGFAQSPEFQEIMDRYGL